MAQPVRLVNIGLRCNCNKILPILVEELPRIGLYVCPDCKSRFHLTVEERENELPDT
jgi:transcription elongation factor Elf1